MSQEGVQVILTMLGGLAMFIYGMNLMSDGLQKAAGDKMRSVLALLTRNPVIGVLAGALTTAVLQSSSATTVMVIGFVSAGLMKLPQAISVILGANIGTTITAQLIAFKIGDYAWAFVVVGFIMFFFLKKKEKVSNIGQTMFAFGLLFVGINTMGETLKPLAASPVFAELMTHVQDIPALGVLVGTLMTVVVQSSSATIAVLQNLASTAGPDGIHSVLGLSGAIPILFGDNIGTTITALLASIGASVNAKRTAVAHTIFNICGTLIFIWFIPQIVTLITYISPKGPEVQVVSRQIANTHMAFNVTNTLIFLPLIWVLVKIVTKIIPDKKEEQLPSQPIYLDVNVIDRPLFAIYMATKELSRLATFAHDMISHAKAAFIKNDQKEAEKVFEKEKIVNDLQEKTVNYLSSIYGSDTLTEHQAQEISGLLHVAADIEHVGDHCENIAEFAVEKAKNQYEFSESATNEIDGFFDKVSIMMGDSLSALDLGDRELATKIIEEEKAVNRLERNLRQHHMERLNRRKCSPQFTVMYTDIIHNLEKMGDYCKNIAEAVLEDINFKKNEDIENTVAEAERENKEVKKSKRKK